MRRPPRPTLFPLHDALPISSGERVWRLPMHEEYRELMKSPVADILNSNPNRKAHPIQGAAFLDYLDRKSTRLNSSHSSRSYAVFCLKKKKLSKHSEQPSRRY